MKFYFAAPFGYSPQLLPLKIEIEANGRDKVTSSWLMIPPEYKSKTAMEASDFALQDLADVDACDMLVLFNPEGAQQSPGRNIEFGYALARGKALGIVGAQRGVFQWLPQIISFPSNLVFIDWYRKAHQVEYTG